VRRPSAPARPRPESVPATGARYRRLAKRRGKGKAQVATGNTLLTIAHALLSGPTADYHDLGADYYEARSQHHRQVTSHIRGLQLLGYRVTLDPIDDAA
jgi:transposase